MKRVRRPKSGGRREVAPPASRGEGFPSFEHNSFTFEGEIERFGAMGRNLSNAPRWARIVAKVVVLCMLIVFAIGLVQFLANLVTS